MKKMTSLLGILLVTVISFAQTARVQIIHNSADAAAQTVDVWLNNTLLLDNFQFRTATPFVNAPAGVPLEIRIKDQNSTDTLNPIALFNVTLAANETYVVVADGIVSPTGYSPAPGFNLEVYGMGREAASNPSQVDVLVHHGSTDAPTVDVAEVGVVNATIVNNLGYTDYQGYLELPTADYTLQILDAAGLTPVAAYLAPLSTLNLQGAALVVVASGFLNPANNSNGAAFGLYAALPSGGPLVALPGANNLQATAQIIHNSADLAAAEVDVYLNDVLALDNFAFRTATPFITLPAGVPFDVSIQPANSTDTVNALAKFSYTLADGEQYMIIANGIVSPSGYSPVQAFDLYVTNQARTAAANNTETDVLVFHGATDAPTVDVAEVGQGAGTIVDNLAYGTFAGYLELPTADYRLAIQDETGANTLFVYDAPLQQLNLQGAALAVLASGFVDPAQNSNGEGFGLYVALPAGGALIPLPITTGIDVKGVIGNTTLFPNPAATQATLQFSMESSADMGYFIVDVQGRIVAGAQLGTLAAGDHFINLEIGNLSIGQYRVVLTGTQGATTLPLMIQR